MQKVLNRPRDVARVSRHVGVGWLRLGNLKAAEQELTTAKEAFAALGDERGLGSTMRNLATTRRLQGRLDEAHELALHSRVIARAKPDSPLVPMTSPFGAGAAEEELGRIAGVLGNTPSSIRHLRSACNIFEAIGHARSRLLTEELGDHRDALIPKPRGIIFGLFDTLAQTKREDYENLERRFSVEVGIQHNQFKAAWARSRDRASTDPGWSSEDRIQWVAGEFGVSLTPAVVDEFAELERVFWSSSVVLRPRALDFLASLHRRKIKLAIVANCSNAMRGLPELLGLVPFLQVSVLSCDIGALKPNKIIYKEALRRLNLSADQCIYIGDGTDRELEGARAVGLFTVRLLMGAIPNYSGSESLDWDATVGSLDKFTLRLGEIRT